VLEERIRDGSVGRRRRCEVDGVSGSVVDSYSVRVERCGRGDIDTVSKGADINVLNMECLSAHRIDPIRAWRSAA